MRAPSRLAVLTLSFLFVLSACGSAAPTSTASSAGSSVSATSTSPSASEAGTGSPTGDPAATASASAVATAAGTQGSGSSAAPGESDPGVSPAPSAVGDSDWPVYHLNAQRTGYLPTFPTYRGTLAVSWNAKLDGAVYAEPLVVGSHVLVATEGDTVYSLNATNGAIVWARKVGTPVRRSTLPCGNIDPLGITGTPVYDAVTGSLFVVAEVTGPKHMLFALDAATGAIRWSRQVDLPGDDPTTHQQRAALALGSGLVYIGFGGLAGDCGQYTGKVVAVPTTGAGSTISYRVPAQREGAIWATGGPVIDPNGNLYVSVGNGSSTTTFDGSDSVVELSPTLQQKSIFAPSTWAQDNARDADLGSGVPTLLSGGYVFIAGKAGIGYVLRQGSLGGIGGEVSSKTICASYGGTASIDNQAYLPCTDGVRMVSVAANGQFSIGWHTPSGSNGPPVIGGKTVWTIKTATGTLYALDIATGGVQGSIAVGSVPHFATPTLWRDLVFVGTMSGVVAVRV